MFEVCFDRVVVAVDCSSQVGVKTPRRHAAVSSTADDASFASTATPSDASVGVPRVYGDGRNGHARFIVLECTALRTLLRFLPECAKSTKGAATGFPDVVGANIVSASRTAAFARFLVPSVEVYLDLTRDALTYVTKMFQTCQTMCGLKTTCIPDFLRDVTTEEGVITTDYAGSAFHSACEGVVKTFSSCRDVSRMDVTVSKPFIPVTAVALSKQSRVACKGVLPSLRP